MTLIWLNDADNMGPLGVGRGTTNIRIWRDWQPSHFTRNKATVKHRITRPCCRCDRLSSLLSHRHFEAEARGGMAVMLWLAWHHEAPLVFLTVCCYASHLRVSQELATSIRSYAHAVME